MRGQTLDVAGFFAERLTHSHPDRSLDLAFDREGIDGMAAVQCGPDLVDRYHASCIVDAYLHHLRGIAEAHGRTHRAAPVFAALGLGRTGERTRHGDRAAIDKRLLHDFGEGKARLIAVPDPERFTFAFDVFGPRFGLAGSRLDKDGLEFAGRVDRRVAYHKRDARRVGAVVLGRHRAVGGDYAHALDRHTERFGNRNGDHGGGALADVRRPGERGNTAVEVEPDIHGRVWLSGPVNRLGRAADIVRAGHAEALAVRQLADTLAPSARGAHPFQGLPEPI